MNRDEVLAEIRRRADREHGTLVQALNILLDDKLTGMRKHIETHLGGPVPEGHIGYMLGLDNAAGYVEEALQEAFSLWPDNEPRESWRDRLPLSDRQVELSRELWVAVMAVLDGHGNEHERDAVRHELLTLGWASWYPDLDDPTVIRQRLQALLPKTRGGGE
ncbi:hypothetical protein SAMN04489712_13830 [Thermomonospora echinospora]|uniref:Uncharacterized protein n=1 Tax=Thermomonospora echinospora TaxID=1992 RepID=A0A1H6E6T4_9ACTN|nr:hypothetical protein [Thermomonospora echinospora]SEG93357.1 hypothetical protein SAMN04489712_13830 [Thermomonospora echinospora]